MEIRLEKGSFKKPPREVHAGWTPDGPPQLGQTREGHLHPESLSPSPRLSLANSVFLTLEVFEVPGL